MKSKAYYGDLHTHCQISYAHGGLPDSIRNAQERLDFCSITGHAHWPDMPEPNERIQYIIDFHQVGFERLKKCWPKYLELIEKANTEGSCLFYPGFEMHSNADGDRTIIYNRVEGEIHYADDLQDLHKRLKENKEKTGLDAIAFPHHIGYRKGARGINWSTFDEEWAPFVELYSMHGCSESSENTRPFLHSMGGHDWEGTSAYGLEQGHKFGLIACTDHHSAHPASYGHGMTGVWADEHSHESIWSAMKNRRVWAMTGDKIEVDFDVNGVVMGAEGSTGSERTISGKIKAAHAIDYVDILRNNKLIKRYSQCDIEEQPEEEMIRTQLYVEVGWGAKGSIENWDVSISLPGGEIIDIDTRFRGQEVVSPVEKTKGSSVKYYTGKCSQVSDSQVTFEAQSTGNPTNYTPATQGISIEMEVPRSGMVEAVFNGKEVTVPVERLIQGAKTGNLAEIDSPAYRLHRLPLAEEMLWDLDFTDNYDQDAVYTVKVRQRNDQWAWSSPVFITAE